MPNPLIPPEVPFPYPSPEFLGISPAPPIPVVYESGDGSGDKLTLRAYAAIQLRVPDSGLEWLDQMIIKSRQLDRVPHGPAMPA